MNREIKFRYIFKRKEDGHLYVIIEGLDSLEGRGDDQVRGMFVNPLWEFVARSQHTGLKDTKGVDYYEGDLTSNNLTTDKETIREIRFVDGAWQMVRVKGNSRLPKMILLFEWAGLNMPIVGNIHENPELLDE